MKRLVILAVLTLLFAGAWVDGQYDLSLDALAWTTADDPNETEDPNEVEDPNEIEDPNEVEDPGE